MEKVRHKNSKVPTINEGNRQIPRQRRLSKLASDYSSNSSSTTEKDVFTCELGRSSSNRVTGTQVKKLLAEEMSKEIESKRRVKKLLAEEMSKETDSKGRPPSIIARLMGLDGLPPQQPLHGRHRGFLESYRVKTGLLASERDGKPYECRLNRKHSMEQQEFKDVYEVLETSKVERASYQSRATLKSKLSEAERAFIRKKIMDTKCLSTNEKFHNSKEFCDTLDMVDTNKDLLMKFLQQPDTLFKKHLIDLRGAAPRTECSRIAVLKPSNLEKCESNTIGWKSENDILRCDTVSQRKHHDGLAPHSYKYGGAQKLLKSSKIQLERKCETDILPKRIVVLKPNLEKVQNAAQSVSSQCSSHGSPSDCRKEMEYKSIGTCAARPRFKKNLSNDEGTSRPKSRESREKAKEITRRMRESFRGEPIDLASVFKGYAGDESSYDVSGSDSGSESEVSMPTSRKSFHWNNWQKPLSSHSIESSVSMEAKKRLSERWKMSQRNQDVGTVGKGSTLGEMLAIPDWEMWPEHVDPVIGFDGSSDRFASNGEIVGWDSPLGISSSDGWKNGCVGNASRLSFVAASSLGCGGPKTSMQYEGLDQDSYLMPGEPTNQRKHEVIKGNFLIKEDYSSSQKLSFGSKRTQFSCTYGTDSLDEMPFNQSQMEINLGKKVPSEQKKVASKMPTINVNDKSLITNAEEDTGHKDRTIPSESSDGLPQEPSACLLEDSVAQDSKIGPSEEGSVPLQCPGPEPQSPASSKEADHLSPVSVLEIPFTEDISSGSECFERVSADLHDLRMQLKLLKMESGPCDDGGMIMSSDKDVVSQGFVTVSEEKGMLTDESWESSYLVDVLTYSGFENINPDTFVSTWHSPDCPLDPSVFENLEKQYRDETTWLRSERKLLFDCINSGICDMFKWFEDPYPWVKKPVTRKVGPKWQKNGIRYELLKLLVSEEKKANEDVAGRVLDREMQWLDFGEDIDVIGWELEKLLVDDLIAEVANMFYGLELHFRQLHANGYDGMIGSEEVNKKIITLKEELLAS